MFLLRVRCRFSCTSRINPSEVKWSTDISSLTYMCSSTWNRFLDWGTCWEWKSFLHCYCWLLTEFILIQAFHIITVSLQWNWEEIAVTAWRYTRDPFMMFWLPIHTSTKGMLPYWYPRFMGAKDDFQQCPETCDGFFLKNFWDVFRVLNHLKIPFVESFRNQGMLQSNGVQIYCGDSGRYPSNVLKG